MQTLKYIYHLSIAVPVDVKCPKLKVSGEYHVNGTYIITALRSKGSPSRPVYKKQGSDRYIYHYPGTVGWRIGPHAGVVSDESSTIVAEFYYKSRYSSISKES